MYPLLHFPRKQFDRISLASIEDCRPFSQFLVWKVNDPALIDVSCTVPILCFLKDVGIISASKLLLLCVEWKHRKEDKSDLKSGLSFHLQDLPAPGVGEDL